jgi:tyrosine-protein phosphatase SIW14
VTITRVDERLYRGARPTAAEYGWLASNVRAIVNLEGDDVAADDYLLAAAEKLQFLWFPITPAHVYLDPPPLALIRYIVGWLDQLPAPIYVHCQHGQDRTGLVVAAYRIAHGWTWEQAHSEALALGYRAEINFGLNATFEQLR